MKKITEKIEEKAQIKNTKKIEVSEKRIFKKRILILLVVIVAGYSFWYFKYRNHKNGSTQSKDIIQEYKDQLPDLKKKAESKKAEDLQNYGVAQYATGDLGGAEATYRKQVAADANSSVAHNNLGNALRDEKKFDEAIAEYEAAIKIAPKTISTYANLGSVYQYSQSNIDKAIEVYKRGIETNADSVDLYMLLALAYEQKKDSDNARKTYEKILTLQPESVAAKAGLERVGSK